MEEFGIKQKPLVVLGEVQRTLGIWGDWGFSFLAPLDMDEEKIHKNQVVTVESANGGTIIAKINIRRKAEDDYFCECENVIFIDKNGLIVDESSYPLTQTPVHRVEKMDLACERV